jgi:hypothetical protein
VPCVDREGFALDSFLPGYAMRAKHFWIAVLLGCFSTAVPASASVETLTSLPDPTLQTLITMGSTPVSVGQLEFSDFSLVNTIGAGGVTAEQIQVLPSNSGVGLQFVSSWFAADGSYTDEVVSFDVRAMDSSKPICQISLLANGTAPAPATGTFTTTTLVSELPDGVTAAPLISTYDDGFIVPVDTTKPDVDYVQTGLVPQPELLISDTIFESSTPAGGSGSGGVATESIVQNAFSLVQVPEPGPLAWLLVPTTVVISQLNRRGSAGRGRRSTVVL